MKDSSDIRKRNTNKIRRLLWKGGAYTKQRIAVETGLSVATCNTLLNNLAQRGEVVGEKKRLNEVGPGSVLYQINEAYEYFLCIYPEQLKGKKLLTLLLLSVTGRVLEQIQKEYTYLDYASISEEVECLCQSYRNLSFIAVGIPGIAEKGIIRHCDIEELEDTAIVKNLEQQFQIAVHLENDMHFKAYGYYKKCGDSEGIITLANFPAHVLPGTASVHAGMILKGKNQFAGMVGFLPYGMERSKELLLLEKETCRPLVSQAIASVIAMINPGTIVFTGDMLEEGSLEWIREDCLLVIPEEYMPEFIYRDSLDDYYIEGMYQKILDRKESEESFLW